MRKVLRSQRIKSQRSRKAGDCFLVYRAIYDSLLQKVPVLTYFLGAHGGPLPRSEFIQRQCYPSKPSDSSEY